MSNLTPYEVSNQSNPYPLIADSKWLQTKLGWIWLDHYVDVRHLRQLDSSTFRPPNLWRFWSGPEIVKLHEIPRVFFGRKESNFGEKKEISKKEKPSLYDFMHICKDFRIVICDRVCYIEPQLCKEPLAAGCETPQAESQ